jgi:LAO/AO transport system kinase
VSDGAELGRRLREGDLSAAPAALNLVESRTRTADVADLLREVSPAAIGAEPRAHVIGVTGPPGAGKSLLLSALVHAWRDDGRTVAVLAVDPSSKRSGGALLGDRARIAFDPEDRGVLIRSTAAGNRLGGLAPATRAAAQALSAAYDVVVIETVGVGQSEIAVRGMSDCFVLLLLAGAGDELQGLKRGIMELADLVVVNKADGELASVAAHTAADYAAALHLVRPRLQGWTPRVLTCSALTGTGIPEVWETVAEFRTAIGAELSGLRAGQNREWMWSEVTDSLLDALTADAATAALARQLEAEVAAGTTTPTAAARAVVAAHLGSRSS